MSVAVPTAKGATVTIAGKKISWDAILIALAGVGGVFFLFKAGQPSSSAGIVAAGDPTTIPAPTSGVVTAANPGAPPPAMSLHDREWLKAHPGYDLAAMARQKRRQG